MLKHLFKLDDNTDTGLKIIGHLLKCPFCSFGTKGSALPHVSVLQSKILFKM